MKHNLIIVDDHKMFLDGVISILGLEKEYNIILTSTNGKHVLKYLDINSDEKIDLIITDISMPELDGITLNKKVKEKNKNIKTLIVSMHNDAEMIDKLTEDGVDGFIAKKSG